MTSRPSDDSPKPMPDPSLLRLAHAVAELNPHLARSLCLAGLATIKDPRERERWDAQLASFLDERSPFGAGPSLPA